MLGLPALPKILSDVFEPKSKWVNMTRRAWIGGKEALQLAFGNNPIFTDQLGKYNGVNFYYVEEPWNSKNKYKKFNADASI